MEIKQITDKNYAKIWDNFIIANSNPSSFLQSWSWGKFKVNTQNSINNKQENRLFRYAIYDDNKLTGVAQFIKQRLPGGKFYLNCPRGPIISKQSTINNQQLFELLKNKIEEISKQEKIIFFRIAPPYHHLNTETLKHLSTPKILTNLMEPKNTLLLDLSQDEDELLKNMHHKTRYNIRLAEKKGVKIKQGNTDDINVFYKLLQETAKRDKINIFNKDYYKKLLITHLPAVALAKEGYSLLITLFTAEYNNTPLSAIIVIGFGNTATYLHGASSSQHRELMPNHLIQWTSIKWAKKNNYKYYDFWGINHQKKDWAGITRFKKGFVSQKTGKEINYTGTFDYIINKKWYNIYKLGKSLTRLRSPNPN